jgi:hypothetical protein
MYLKRWNMKKATREPAIPKKIKHCNARNSIRYGDANLTKINGPA